MSKLPETIILPGFVDVHDHFRWPGSNKSENFKTGTLAAIKGGVIMTNDMPNTPGRPTYNLETVLEKERGVYEQSYHPMGLYTGADLIKNNVGELEAMSRVTLGLKLYLGATTGYEYMEQIGIREYEDHIREWHRVAPKKPILVHRGDAPLDEIIYLVADKYGHPLHLCHINSSEEVQLINNARGRLSWRQKPLEVTCGVCPHHIFKTSHDVMTYGSMARMVPALADQHDSERLLHELAAGNIQKIETDHAPHPFDKKMEAEVKNPDGIQGDRDLPTCNGVPGVQEAASLFLNQVRIDNIELERFIDAFSTQPARLLGVKLSKNTEVKMSSELYQIDQDYEIESGAGRSLYLGCLAVGKVTQMKIGGRIIIRDGKVVDRAPRVIHQRGESI